jgi:hypothetical protein
LNIFSTIFNNIKEHVIHQPFGKESEALKPCGGAIKNKIST